MARSRWFLQYASRIALFSLFGAVALAAALLASITTCVQPHASCGTALVAWGLPALGAALGLLFLGWGTLSDLLILTQSRRERAAHWLAGTPDPKHAISPGAMVGTLLAAAGVWVVGSLVSREVGVALAGVVLVLGLSLPMLLRSYELWAVRSFRLGWRPAGPPANAGSAWLPAREASPQLPPPPPLLPPPGEILPGDATPNDASPAT